MAVVVCVAGPSLSEFHDRSSPLDLYFRFVKMLDIVRKLCIAGLLVAGDTDSTDSSEKRTTFPAMLCPPEGCDVFTRTGGGGYLREGSGAFWLSRDQPSLLCGAVYRDSRAARPEA